MPNPWKARPRFARLAARAAAALCVFCVAGFFRDPARAQTPAAYQAIFDVEGPNFEFLGGVWTLDYSGVYQDSYFFTTPGPGDGSARARWVADGLPPGLYDIEFWAQNNDFPEDARFEVISRDAITTLSLNLNYRPNGWYSLGQYMIEGVCVVYVSNFWTGAGSKLAVDSLRFTLVGAPPPPPASPFRPRVGICIDDAGSVSPTSPSSPIYTILRQPFPLTIAVMPQLAYTAATAEEVHSRGFEVILHQPMAAISVADPGPGGIRDAMTLEEVRATVTANLDALPHGVGVNNHMGSLITQQADKMDEVLRVCRERGLYFLDSRTYTLSVAYDRAKRLGAPTAERDLFIDGNSVETSKALIRRLALRALYAPDIPHVGIGHVRANTAAALAEIAPELQAMGVDLVPVSRIVTQVIEVDARPEGAGVQADGAWSVSPDDLLYKELADGTLWTFRAQTLEEFQEARVRFTAAPSLWGLHDVYLMNCGPSGEGLEWEIRVRHRDGLSVVSGPAAGVAPHTPWRVGRFPFEPASPAWVELRPTGPPGDEPAPADLVWKADAVKFVRAGETQPALRGWMGW